MIEKCGRIFTIRGAECKVTALYKEAVLEALDHLGVMPRPDPRKAMEEKNDVIKD